MRVKRRRWLCVALLGVVTAGFQFAHTLREGGAVPLAAQENRRMLAVSVDGRTDPELVPDEYAYRHLLAATALSEKLTPEQRAFVRARVRRIGLSDLDRAAYEAGLQRAGVRDELARIDEERKALTRDRTTALAASAAGTLAHLRSQEEDVLVRARQEVLRGLSSAGAAVLDSHVRLVVKRQIRILTGPAHGPAAH